MKHHHAKRMSEESLAELQELENEMQSKKHQSLYKSLMKNVNKRLDKAKESLRKSDNSIDILKELNQIKSTLIYLLTMAQAGNIKNKLKDFGKAEVINTPPKSPKDGTNTPLKSLDEATKTPALSPKEAKEELDKVATVKVINDVKHFILYHPTENFEYDKSKDKSEFTTQGDTEWTHDEMTAASEREGKNPMVGAFIPEDAVKEILNPRTNNSLMGEGLKNPQHQDFKVVVKPGTYKLYMEITP